MKQGFCASDIGDPNDLNRFISAQERIFDHTLFAALKKSSPGFRSQRCSEEANAVQTPWVSPKLSYESEKLESGLMLLLENACTLGETTRGTGNTPRRLVD
jgi:hypothetical protein